MLTCGVFIFQSKCVPLFVRWPINESCFKLFLMSMTRHDRGTDSPAFLCLHSSSGSSSLTRGRLTASRTSPSPWPNPGSRRSAKRRSRVPKPNQWGPRNWKAPAIPSWGVEGTEGRRWTAKNNHRSVRGIHLSGLSHRPRLVLTSVLRDPITADVKMHPQSVSLMNTCHLCWRVWLQRAGGLSEWMCAAMKKEKYH